MAKLNKLALRHEARVLAMQALYAWKLSGYEIEKVKEEMLFNSPALLEQMPVYDESYFNELTHNVAKHAKTLDTEIDQYLDRHISQINPVELSILRIALYELKFNQAIPHKVILNEAIILAKKFGAVEGHKYINGVLDKLAKQFRTEQMQEVKQSA